MLEINNMDDFKQLINNDYSNLDKFIQRKIDFIRERNNIFDMTKYIYFRNFYSFIYPIEKVKNKDLALFNEGDIEQVIVSIPTNSLGGVQYSIFNLMSMYEKWAIDKGYNPTCENPCDNLKFSELDYNKNLFSRQYLTKDDVVEIYEEAKTHDISMTAQNLAAFLLVRYGLAGVDWCEPRFLRWEDIDFENKIINVTNRSEDNLYDLQVVKKIKMDDTLITVLEEARATLEYDTIAIINKVEKIQHRIFYDYGYVLKTNRTKTQVLNATGLRSRIKDIFDAAGREFISLKNILLSQEIDDLLHLKNKNGHIYISDLKNVKEKYEYVNSAASHITLKNVYMDLTGDKDIRSTRYNYDENGNRINKKYRKQK